MLLQSNLRQTRTNFRQPQTIDVQISLIEATGSFVRSQDIGANATALRCTALGYPEEGFTEPATTQWFRQPYKINRKPRSIRQSYQSTHWLFARTHSDGYPTWPKGSNGRIKHRRELLKEQATQSGRVVIDQDKIMYGSRRHFHFSSRPIASDRRASIRGIA